MSKKREYLIDTSHLQCSEADYEEREKTFGEFTEGGKCYKVLDGDTPRPWFNYFCNEKFGTSFSTTLNGFSWYLMPYNHISAYCNYFTPETLLLSRRIIKIIELESGKEWDVFADSANASAEHHFGWSVFKSSKNGLDVNLKVFVPLEDSGECWELSVSNSSSADVDLKVSVQQVWEFAANGSKDEFQAESKKIFHYKAVECDHMAQAHCVCDIEPENVYRTFMSTNLKDIQIQELESNDSAKSYSRCSLSSELYLGAGQSIKSYVFSGAEQNLQSQNTMIAKYLLPESYKIEYKKLCDKHAEMIESHFCSLPDKNIEMFLNVWLKNQLNLTFHTNRGHLFGFRDTMQDTWGYTLMAPAASKKYFLNTLSKIRTDGVCPRQFSLSDSSLDMRKYMDSAIWIAQTLVDYIKETGDYEILHEKVCWGDSNVLDTVEKHVWTALDFVFKKRGLHGFCLVGDGDWNDALEGISRKGKAVSVWLTIALYHAQELLAELYDFLNDNVKLTILRERSSELKKCVNENAWDGKWFIYGFDDNGTPIGSKVNSEGKIHLNAQTWAVFSGITDKERSNMALDSIQQYLETDFGPRLIAPCYDKDESVGRIANLEPGTFENGSIYIHSVCFKILADLINGRTESAVNTVNKILPSNPENFDCRRTSEPYCIGNFYCGPEHPRHGQNFFSWYTGTASWLLRVGFDYLLGIKAGFNGLKINPHVPASWAKFYVNKTWLGCKYKIYFQQIESIHEAGIWVDSKKIESNIIIPSSKPSADVVVKYTKQQKF